METLNETQTQNKNATSLWQTIGMMVGFLYPQIGLGLGMLLGIALGRLVLTKIPVNTPLAQRAQQKSTIILILAFLILFMNHWYVPCKHAIAHLMNKNKSTKFKRQPDENNHDFDRTKEKPKDAYLKKQIPSGRMRKSVLPLNSNPF